MKNMLRNVVIALTMITSTAGYANVKHDVVNTSQYDKKKKKGAAQPKMSKAKKRAIKKDVETGLASWYGKQFIGRKTASGERLTNHNLTAAHKHLPLGSVVKVTNTQTKEEVIVTINDRGPYKHGRILDLAPAAAKKIGLMTAGLAKVKMEVISIPL